MRAQYTKDMPTGIYLLPNLFTTASLFAAFYSIVSSLKGDYEWAVIAIFIGMIADSLDGRVARLTRTQTAFGAQYDSLSDMVTFGVAPALLLYSWTLHSLGKVGWLVAFMYTASVALRLARFNTQLEVADKRYFQGLPCPPAAGVLSAFVWLCHKNAHLYAWIPFVAAVITVIIGVLMVSNIRYYSFKEVDSKGKVPFFYVLFMVVLFIAIAAYPSGVLCMGLIIYAVSGPIQTIWGIKRARRHHPIVRGRSRGSRR